MRAVKSDGTGHQHRPMGRSKWTALGSGLNSTVYSLAVSGSDLYAGRQFTTAGGNAADRIAKWNGSIWTALGSGMNSTVAALAVSGSDLYAGAISGRQAGRCRPTLPEPTC